MTWERFGKTWRKVHPLDDELRAYVVPVVGGFRWRVRMDGRVVDRGTADSEVAAKCAAWRSAQVERARFVNSALEGFSP